MGELDRSGLFGFGDQVTRPAGHAVLQSESNPFLQGTGEQVWTVSLSSQMSFLVTERQRLSREIEKVKKPALGYTKICFLLQKQLKSPLDVIVEPDDGGYIARTIDLPLYGYGDDAYEAVEALKEELDGIYSDLLESDDFSDEWLSIKKFLRENVAEK